MICKIVGCEEGVELVIQDKGPHYAKYVCFAGHFNDWVPKPDSDKSKRPAKHAGLVHKYGNGYCELCGRTESTLRDSDVLEAHHVLEYSGTPDSSRENVWIVCTACHRLIHHMRTYHGRSLHLQADLAEDIRA